jgi:hypothetical protein
MFLEVLNEDTYQGDIGLATSKNGITWHYEQIVLDEPFHLSYPHVVRWKGEYFMVPESQEAGAVRLYRASEFPKEWQLERTLVTGQSLADPSVFRYQNMWWMFVGTAWTHDTLRLFFADELSGPWTEHPQSPIVRVNPDIARPGGRVTEFEGELYRFGQDCHPRYGNQLRAFHIASLSRNEYREEPIESGPVLRASGSGWNTTGMHHSDPVLLPSGRWRACVDGHRKVWLWRLQ